MLRLMENIVNLFARIMFDEQNSSKNGCTARKDKYTLSSVFPSTRIMEEVEKNL